MTALPSASQLDRALGCPASAVLPRVDTVSEASSLGSAVHAFMEDVTKLGAEEALARITDPTARLFAESVPLDRLPVGEGKVAAEVAFAYDPEADTARELGRSIGRKYREAGLDPCCEYPATVDVVGLGDGFVYLADWKTGHGPVPSPPGNWQLRLGAIAACRTYGVSSAVVQVIHLGDDGSVWRDPREPATLDAFDLDVTRATLLDLAGRVRSVDRAMREGRIPDTTVGRHCHGCRCVANCPAAGLAVRSLVSQLDGGDPLCQTEALAAGLDARTASEFLGRIEVVERALDIARTAIRLYAREHPIPVGDGKVWGPRTLTRETLDGATVYHVVRERCGEELARRAVEWKSSKTAIDDVAREVVSAAKAKGERATLKAERERILDAVRERGGVSSSTWERFDAYKET